MSYSDKLKDPRWQKKRLEIFLRDDFTCISCGDKSSTLHIHHAKYIGQPWDINSEFLSTLCETCHKKEHAEPVKLHVVPSTEFEEMVITEEWILSHDFNNRAEKTRVPRSIKTFLNSIKDWEAVTEDKRFINQAKNDLSDYCYQYKIILNCLNGDIYGNNKLFL